jgi:hypothetical protein
MEHHLFSFHDRPENGIAEGSSCQEVDGAPELCFRGFLHLHETVKKMIFRREVDHQVDVAGRGLLATSY